MTEKKCIDKRHTLYYICKIIYYIMEKEYKWNYDKNLKLIVERNISFEDILIYIEQGCVIDVIDNTFNDNYKNQRIFILNIQNYIYYVPFVENEKEIFLKTIIPSRKLTKKYLGKKQ